MVYPNIRHNLQQGANSNFDPDILLDLSCRRDPVDTKQKLHLNHFGHFGSRSDTASDTRLGEVAFDCAADQ